MTGVGMISQATVIVRETGARQKLLRLPHRVDLVAAIAAAALPASCSASARPAPIGTAGGRPPLAAAALPLPLPRTRAGILVERPAAGLACLLASAADEDGQGPIRYRGLMGRGTGHGRGLDRVGNAMAADAGALTSMGRGAGA